MRGEDAGRGGCPRLAAPWTLSAAHAARALIQAAHAAWHTRKHTHTHTCRYNRCSAAPATPPPLTPRGRPRTFRRTGQLSPRSAASSRHSPAAAGSSRREAARRGAVRSPLPEPAAPADSGPALINELEPPLRPHLGVGDWVAAVMGNKRVWLRASSGSGAAEGCAGAACVIFPVCPFEPRGAGHSASRSSSSGRRSEAARGTGSELRAPSGRPAPRGRPGLQTPCGTVRFLPLPPGGSAGWRMCRPARGRRGRAVSRPLGAPRGPRGRRGDCLAGKACGDWELADCRSLLPIRNCGSAACKRNMELFFFFFFYLCKAERD